MVGAKVTVDPSGTDVADGADETAPTTAVRAVGVGDRVRSGVKWGAADQVFQQVLRLSLTVVLARLTPPSAFGLIAMGFLVTTLASWITDMGFGSALVQRRSISDLHVRTAVTATLVMGIVLAGVASALAAPMAAYFGEEELALVIVVLSINFPVKGLAGIPRDLLRRHLMFKEFAIGAGFAVTVSATAALVLAVNGAGVWALVAYSVVESFAALLAYFVIARRRLDHRFGFGFGRREFRDLAGFGASVAGSRLVYYVMGNIDNLIVGKVLGATALGLYGLAYRIMLYPIQKVADVIVSVAMPAFATMQGDRVRLREGFLRGQQAICLVCFPASIGIAVSAPLLVPLLVGDQWLPAVASVQILALAGPRIALGRLNGSVFQACGKPQRELLIAVVSLAVLVPAFLVGTRYGFNGVATAFTVVGWCLVPLSLVPVARLVGTTARHALWVLWPISLATVVMAGCSELGRRALTGTVPDPAALALVVLIGALTYVGTLLLVDRPLLRNAPAAPRAPLGTAAAH